MPDWTQKYDIYNNTCDNFNPRGVKCITDSIMKKYFPYGEVCMKCLCKFEQPQRVCFGTDICLIRNKDEKLPDVILCKGVRGDNDTLQIRSGNMTWLHHHRVPFILRACNENGLTLHHIDGNPFNNCWWNVVMTDIHESFHGEKRSFSTAITNLIIESSQVQSVTLLKEIERLKRVYKKYVGGITDSPRVWKIINIINQVLQGTKSVEDAQKQLEDLSAAFPIGVKGRVDFRKIKTEKARRLLIDESAEPL